MRVLLLMRGAMGCGKSTFIEQHGLKPYTLCADDIRLLCQSPVLDTNGKQKISQKKEYRIHQNRFRHGITILCLQYIRDMPTLPRTS